MTAKILSDEFSTEGAYTMPPGTGSVLAITAEPDADLAADDWILAERTDRYSRWYKRSDV